LIALTSHGALYLAVKTENELNRRALNVALRAWPLQLILTVLGLAATIYIRPSVLENYKQHVVGYLIPLVVFCGLGAMVYGARKQQYKLAFAGSVSYIVAMLAGAAFALYPVVLPSSSDPARSLTISSTAAAHHGTHRRDYLVECRPGSGVGILHFSISHVSRKGPAGGGRVLIFDRCHYSPQSRANRQGLPRRPLAFFSRTLLRQSIRQPELDQRLSRDPQPLRFAVQ
jgi:hypothetical protein